MGQVVLSQEKCNFRGMLMDSLNLPVYDASVTAFDKDNRNTGFVFSDEQGEFKLEMPCRQDYELEVEHVSYKPKVVKIHLDKSKRQKIVLSHSVISLDEVVAEGRVPIKMKGDTIEYDALSFQTGKEENLEDILKNLPGITVEEGNVYYQGKKIQSIKVEGREIFGGNQKLVTKNLPSDAVDKIQLNEKFKANPFASSLQDDEQPELNIVLKEDKKNLIFGNVTLGGDADTHADFQRKTFYFSRKLDATFLSDYNTYGREVFSRQDYFQFMGGMSEFAEEGGVSLLRNALSEVGFNTDNNANKWSDFLNAANLGYQPNKRLNVSGFGMATRNKAEYKASTQRIYPTLEQRDESNNSQQLFAFISRLNLEYNTRKKGRIKYRANLNFQETKENQDIATFVNAQTAPSSYVTTKQRQKTSTLNQKLSYIKKLGEDDNWGIYLSHIYQKEKPDISLETGTPPFLDYLALTPDNGEYNLQQKQVLHSNTFQFLSVYNHLITNLSNIKFKIGSNYTTQSYKNRTQSYDQIITGQNVLTPTKFNYNEYYADATYTRKMGKIKVDLGTGIHYFKSTNKQTDYENNKLQKGKYLPHIVAEYAFSQSNKLIAVYKQTYSVPQVKEWSRGYDVKSYYNLYEGNPDLQPVATRTASINYYYFSLYKFLNVWAGVSYSKIKNNIRTLGENTGNTQYSQAYNATTPEEQYSANINASKRFTKNYELKGSATLSKNQYQSMVNQQTYAVNTLSQNYKLTQKFKWKGKTEISLGSKLSLNNYESGSTDTRFVNLNPFIETAFMMSDKVLLQADYIYNKQWQNGDFINDNQDLNLSLRIKPAKKVYVKLIGGNLLDAKNLVTNGFNDYYTYVTTKETLGRYFIAQVRYKF